MSRTRRSISIRGKTSQHQKKHIARAGDFGRQSRLKFCEPPRRGHYGCLLYARCDWGLLFNYYKGIKSPGSQMCRMSYSSKQLQRIRDSHNWSQRVTMGHKQLQSVESVSHVVTTNTYTLRIEWKDTRRAAIQTEDYHNLLTVWLHMHWSRHILRCICCEPWRVNSKRAQKSAKASAAVQVVQWILMLHAQPRFGMRSPSREMNTF